GLRSIDTPSRLGSLWAMIRRAPAVASRTWAKTGRVARGGFSGGGAWPEVLVMPRFSVRLTARSRDFERQIGRYRSRAAGHRWPCAAYADAAGAAALCADRSAGVRQIRKSSGHQFVQGAWRPRQARLADG